MAAVPAGLPATFLLERFGSAARNSKHHRAGTQWEQWWDSSTCDYAAQPPVRRSVNRILVRGGSVRQLERVFHAGPICVDRGRRRDEKVRISGASTLLTNAVITYNDGKLHQVPKEAGEQADRFRATKSLRISPP